MKNKWGDWWHNGDERMPPEITRSGVSRVYMWVTPMKKRLAVCVRAFLTARVWAEWSTCAFFFHTLVPVLYIHTLTYVEVVRIDVRNESTIRQIGKMLIYIKSQHLLIRWSICVSTIFRLVRCQVQCWTVSSSSFMSSSSVAFKYHSVSSLSSSLSAIWDLVVYRCSFE